MRTGMWIGAIYNYGTLTITGSTLSGNTASAGMSGAIQNDGMLENNSAPGGQGGGIYNTGNLFMVKDTLTGNSASSGMGGGVALR